MNASTLKQYFEQRAKRQGIEIQNSGSNELDLSQFKGLEFWYWNREEHIKKFQETDGKCCFNHVIGLPKKNGVEKPMFDYENEIFEAFEQTKLIWIKKARGLGVTEFTLRYIAWKCLFNDEWKGKNVCIVTGPRIDTAITLIRRLKKLFPDFIFDDKETVCTLNDVHIEAYPSHNLDSMRGLTDVVLILSDESDFYPMGQQQEMRSVAEGYIAKSNPHIVLVSTPNAPEGLFEQIEKEGENCMYHRMFLPYTRGLGEDKIYSEEEIRKARESPSFEREYNLQYIGSEGDVFNYEKIELAIQSNTELEKKGDSQQQQYTTEVLTQHFSKSMGVDIGWGSSKCGICLTQLIPVNRHYGVDSPLIQVVYAEEFEHPAFDEMVDLILKLKQNCSVDQIYVDSANPEIIRAIKAGLGERTDYEKQITTLKQKHPRHLNLVTFMKVIPVSFREEGREMLTHTQRLLDGGWLAINPKFHKLLIAMRTATATDALLDKTVTSHHDVLDAFRLSLKAYSVEQ